MVKHPDVLVIDAGAHLGQFAIYAAMMNHTVLAIECFYDNIVRIHKAARLSGVDERVTIVTNAISNKRNEIKYLTPCPDNLGAQTLMHSKDNTFIHAEIANNPYMVETILLDDLVDVLPKMANGKR